MKGGYGSIWVEIMRLSFGFASGGGGTAAAVDRWAINPFSFEQYGLSAPEVGVCGR